jgi:cyclomaltodextrinase
MMRSKLIRFLIPALVAGAVANAAGRPRSQDRDTGISRRPREVYEERMADWRNRQVVYQVFVDRFATSGDPARRASLYEAPRRLMPWKAQPKAGTYNETAQVWSHEIDFWGGDLNGLTAKLDYIASLGANVVYLNPIFLGYTNHKYDATDFFTIDPQYGTAEEFARLCDEAHERGMKVVLDGVFNHTGRRSIWFQEALRDPKSRYRTFYTFGDGIKNGYIGWVDIPNLPELNFDNPTVRETIYGSPESVVQSYLAHADGWRLDVAFELGPEVLSELTAAAHRAKPGSYTVGEIYNYPAEWFPALDGVMNMYFSKIILNLADGKLSGPKAGEMIDVAIADSGIEPMLKSWIVLSNHDRARLKEVLPSLRDRTFALALQVTLPGAPLVYYGEELGFTGKEDPEQRGPMDWELAASGAAPEMKLTRDLLALRNTHRALQVGDFVRIPADRLLAFSRITDSVADTVVVVANPANEPVTELLTTRDGFIQDVSPVRDALSGETVEVSAGLMTVTVPPKTVRVFVPVLGAKGPNYYRYKRIP